MRQRFSIDRVLAGLQTGMAGALAMLFWLSLATLWAKHSIWWFPNLMATTFGGDAALQQGFDKYTASGLALHLLQYSLLGLIFAWLVPKDNSRLLLLGIVTGIAWYYLMYGFVWKQMNPLISLYSPDRAILVGHFLFGLMLGRLPRYARASVPAME